MLSADVQDKDFHMRLRGYDKNEVKNFLNQVSADIDKRNKLENQLRKQLDETRKKVDHYTKMQDTMNRSIIVAQHTDEKLKLDASNESKSIKFDANQESKHIIDDSVLRAKTIIQSAQDQAISMINQSKSIHDQLNEDRDNLEKIIMAQQRLLESSPWQTLSDTKNDQIKAINKLKQTSNDYQTDLQKKADKINQSNLKFVQSSKTKVDNQNKTSDNNKQK